MSDYKSGIYNDLLEWVTHYVNRQVDLSPVNDILTEYLKDDLITIHEFDELMNFAKNK